MAAAQLAVGERPAVPEPHWQTLEECFLWRHLGEGSRVNKLAKLQSAVERAKSGQSQLLVVHSPYPTAAYDRSPYAGMGVGKTPLLRAFAARVQNDPHCKILPFTDQREGLTGGNTLLNSYLAPALLAGQGTWEDSMIRYRLQALKVKLGLILHSGGRISVAVTALVLGSLGASAISNYIQDAEHRLSQSAPLLAVVLFLALLLIVLAIRLDIANDRDKRETYRGASSTSLREADRDKRRECLASRPEDALALLDHRKCTVLIVDDVDSLDSRSVQVMLDLFEAATREERHLLCVVLGFNPQNPILRQPDRTVILDWLSKYRVERNHWSVALNPLDREELIDVLWLYYGTPTARSMVAEIERQWPDAAAEPGRLLRFFLWLDEQGVDLTTATGRLSEYVDAFATRNQREVSSTIEEVYHADPTGNAVEFLKVMLAVQTYPARADLVGRVLAGRGINDVVACERVLVGLRLIRAQQHDERTYEFTDRYLRHRLTMAWAEWREQAEDLSSLVFKQMVEDNDWKHPEAAAEQALVSGPSKAAVEALYAQSLHLYEYYGHADASSVLHYLGGPHGALAKWIELCVSRPPAELWELLRWNAITGYNPFRESGTGRARGAPPAHYFAPEIVRLTATAYWQLGYVDDAIRILREQWPTILSRLPLGADLSNWPEEARADFGRVRVELDLLLAWTLLHRGHGADWTEAMDIARRHALPDQRTGTAETTRKRASRQQRLLATAAKAIRGEPVHTADFITASIEHYRCVAVGAWLPPVEFRPDTQTLARLTALADNDGSSRQVRLRALYTALSAVLDTRLGVGSSLHPESVVNDVIEKRVQFAGLEEEHLQLARRLLQQATAVLEQSRLLPAPKPQETPLGRRALDIELLFWQGVYLYCGVIILAVDLGRLAAKYRTGLTTGTYDARLDIYAELTDLCTAFAQASSFRVERRSELLNALLGLREWMDGQRGRGIPRTRGIEIRERFDEAYSDLFRASIDQTTEYLKLADRAYTHFGHRQGHAEVLFQRHMMHQLMNLRLERELSDELLVQSGMLDGAMCDDVGFHLARLVALILVGRDSAAHYLQYSAAAYRAALSCASSLEGDLPAFVVAELAYQLGSELLNLSGFADVRDEAIQCLEGALPTFEKAHRASTSIDLDDARDRAASMHWFLAELRHQQAQGLESDADRQQALLTEAQDHCAWVVRAARSDPALTATAMAARSVRALIEEERGDADAAIADLSTAADYYSTAKNATLWQVQSLTILVNMLLRRPKPDTSLLADRFRSLIEAVQPYRTQVEADPAQLGSAERMVFFSAARLIGSVHIGREVQKQYLFLGFSTLESLGFYGHAISLDELIWPMLIADEEQRLYRDRLVRASQRLDPQESADWLRIKAILRDRLGLHIASAHDDDKLVTLRAARAQLELGELETARDLLESALARINGDNPEEVDLDLLRTLRDLYWRLPDRHDSARELERRLALLSDIAQSRDFLELAKAYQVNNWDPRWALEIATAVDYKQTSYFHEARKRLQEMDTAPT